MKHRRDRNASVVHRVLSTVGASAASQVVGFGASLATLKIASAALGPRNYGYYAAGVAFVTLFGIMTDMGTNAVTPRELARDQERASELVGQNIALRLSLCVVAFVVANALAWVAYSNQDTVRVVVAICSLTLFFDATRAVLWAYLFSIIRGGVAALGACIQQLTLLAVVIVLAIAGRSTTYFAVAYAIAVASSAIYTYARVRQRLRIRLIVNPGAWTKMLKMSVGVGLIQVVDLIYLKIDTILLSVLHGPEHVAKYAIAYTVTTAILVVPGLVMSSLSSIIATRPAETVRTAIRIAMQTVSITTGLGIAVVFCQTKTITELLSGPRYATAAGSMQILVLSTAPSALQYVLGAASVALNRHQRLVWVSVGCLGVNVAMNLLLIPRLYEQGAAWATVASESLALGLTAAVFSRATGIRLDIRRDLGLTAIGCVLAIVAGTVTRRSLPAGIGEIVSALVVSGAVSAVYVSFIVTFGAYPQRFNAWLGRVPGLRYRLAKTQ